MKIGLLSVLLVFSSFSYAEVERSQVELMLEHMVKNGAISKEEAEKAKIKMRTMNKAEWTDINNQVSKAASRMPASVNSASTIYDLGGEDLEDAQLKQINDDIQKIIQEQQK